MHPVERWAAFHTGAGALGFPPSTARERFKTGEASNKYLLLASLPLPNLPRASVGAGTNANHWCLGAKIGPERGHLQRGRLAK